MKTCQYPGCTEPCRAKWCKEHRWTVENEQRVERAKSKRKGKRYVSKGMDYAILHFNDDQRIGRDVHRLDWSNRPLSDVAEYTIPRSKRHDNAQ